MTDSARDPETGAWRVNRYLLAVAAVILGVGVLSVFPGGLWPTFVHDDTALHVASGLALALGGAAVVPVRDDAIVAAVALAGVLWEPAEWWYFACVLDGTCTASDLATWLTSVDTVKDVLGVVVGAFAALVGIGRYQ